MRVAYYYHEAPRLPLDDPDTNPYGGLLSQALERRGIDVEFTIAFDEDYLDRNRGRADVLHFNSFHDSVVNRIGLSGEPSLLRRNIVATFRPILISTVQYDAELRAWE